MRDLFDIRDRVALVTGASSGLGAYFATLLAARGARVAAVGRDRDRLAATAARIAAEGGIAETFECDVTDEARVEACFGEVGSSLGVPDIVVNNAGVSVVKPALSVSRADWEQVMATNLTGAWMIAARAAAAMRDAGKGGSIINITSIGGGRRVLRNASPYVASKAGLTWVTKSLAVELAPLGIRVNAIAPGLFNTSLGGTDPEATRIRRARMIENIPVGRVGEFDELGGPLLLLASDASSYMTGSVLVVDGGYSENSL